MWINSFIYLRSSQVTKPLFVVVTKCIERKYVTRTLLLVGNYNYTRWSNRFRVCVCVKAAQLALITLIKSLCLHQDKLFIAPAPAVRHNCKYLNLLRNNNTCGGVLQIVCAATDQFSVIRFAQLLARGSHWRKTMDFLRLGDSPYRAYRRSALISDVTGKEK